MSYQLLSETIRVARKTYRCIWCPEEILKGEKHIHETSKYDGNFQDHRWHMECEKASKEWFAQANDDSFMRHQCKRGTIEEAW